MLQPKIQPSDGLSFRTCSVFIFMVLQSVGEQSQLICSHQPIVALAGDDVILPCHLEPPMDVRSELVVWIRTDLVPKYIHFHEDGRQVYWRQNPSFKNRTALFVDELKNGNASMKIFKVKISDTGKYLCILNSLMKHTSIQLTVGVVSTPVIEFVSNQSREVVLQCEAKGWYPEPEVFWLDAEGNLLSAGPTETVRGPDDLYTVSRRLTVEKSDSFTCRVQQKNINQTGETHIYVPAHFFRTSSQFAVILSIIIIIITIITITIIIIIIMVKKADARRRRKRREDQQPASDVEKTKDETLL
ncbi:butyrophilin subfamily 1 member A1-like isoform X1 [Larimichthys crocea]|uniref:butyrophilin subfamily 1 member A1-like isoform X1 n=1 Tax=Larimichthys crocea TaxID=215358 RepID=UPI000F602562|nr:butyrophilin subfamily 1 member A1-like isoform X1 [Larimichthys crocea]XP_027138511.1 butyrophilin subfamily 1 member A1-like isoform X1 [Larimichthys crocea]XP_027138512.1 butyrophilin subfamily 1 member A1-like isoform X1 [Larimichthys crocea]XP_027138513.1 butyrophilin subfamily 1 member A1-like isoform X1 [Larimichthys crocea]